MFPDGWALVGLKYVRGAEFQPGSDSAWLVGMFKQLKVFALT